MEYVKRGLVLLCVLCVAGAAIASGSDDAEAESSQEVSVIAQRTPLWEVIDAKLPEFEEASGIDVTIRYFEELERRSKSRIDASTGAGAYDVYYVDEANVAEYVNAGWLVPIEDYYPDDGDFADYLQWMVGVASIDGVPYYAPLWGGGDFLFYRKDILDAAGIEVPETLDEFMDAVKALHNPPELYGFTTRGLRGSGANVWRWQDYFKAFGGEWLDGAGNPTFNSNAAVQATEFYLELIDYSPPGTATSTFVDNVEAFRSGSTAFFIDGDVFYSWMEDPEKSLVAGNVGYAAPPAPMPSGAYVHGLAISAVGAETEAEKRAAAEFIAWATSEEMEMARVAAGNVSEYARSSTLFSAEMDAVYSDEVKAALEARGEVTEVTFMRLPEWPEIGDYLGIVLEELFTGTRTDIQAALDDAVDNAKEVLSR